MQCFKYLAVLAFCVSNFSTLAQRDTDLGGRYENKQIGLKLSLLQNAKGLYEGSFSLQQEVFKATAQMTGGRLSGQYLYNGAFIPFSIAYDGGKYFLSSEGMSLEITKVINGASQVEKGSTGNVTISHQGSGVTPSAGQRKSDPYGGYSFAVPQGWQCREDKGNFVLTKQGTGWQIGVGPHNYNNVNAALQEAIAMQPIQDANTGTFLQPRASAVGQDAIRLTLTGQAQGKPLTIETLNVFASEGGGASLVAVMQGQNDPAAFSILQSISASLQFSKPQQSDIAKAWDQQLRGKQLLYLNSQGGGSDKTTVNLFANGNFDFSSNSNYMSGGSSVFTYADKNAGRGTWKITQRGQQVMLLMFYENGSVEEYPLQQGQSVNEVYSQNRRYFIRNIQ